MEQQQSALDLPLITEATKDFYRQVYANNDLGHIFKGVNMVVLRRHVSFFILQLTAFDTPMTESQIDFLRKVHAPVIEERGATQRHFDILVSLLILSLRSCGAQGTALLMVQSKLRQLRDIFPMHAAASACGSQAGSSLNSVDGTIVLQEGSNREQHAHHGKPQQPRCSQQCQQRQQLRTAQGVASRVQHESPAQQQQQQQQGPQQQEQAPCAACTPLPGAVQQQQQQHCCQHDKQGTPKQGTPKQQQLPATCAPSAPIAIQATQRQQQRAACPGSLKQVVPATDDQQDQLPTACVAPVQHQLDAEQAPPKQQQQPWWKRLILCT